MNIISGSQAEQRKYLLFRNPGAEFGTEKRDHLVQQRLCVAHAAVGGTGDGVNCAFGNLHFFGNRDFVQTVGNHFGGDALQVKTLAPGDNGRQHHMDFCGGENEFDVRRRFFNRFQQGVPCLFGKHVNFVDDIDFIFAVDRHMHDFVAQIADIVHGVLAGGINFNDVNIAFVRN